MITDLYPSDPAVVGPYKLLKRLGQGGMGVVYLARSPGGRQVAVKVIRPEYANDAGFRARFTREVGAARGVSGMFTALVVDADTQGQTPWLATAYVPGHSLAEAVETQGPLPAASVLQLAAGLAEGLQAIHAVGVVHRDLKPSNVLLAADGPRVIDFGISKAREASMLTQTGMVMGSPGFLSPEQAEGREVGTPSDVFSLGGVLTYAATGSGPFGSGPTVALIYRLVTRDPDLSRIPDALRPIIARCLAKDPAVRPTPEDLLVELDELGAGVGVVTPEWLPESITSSIARYVATVMTPATPAAAAVSTRAEQAAEPAAAEPVTAAPVTAAPVTAESNTPESNTPESVTAESAVAAHVTPAPVTSVHADAEPEPAVAADAEPEPEPAVAAAAEPGPVAASAGLTHLSPSAGEDSRDLTMLAAAAGAAAAGADMGGPDTIGMAFGVPGGAAPGHGGPVAPVMPVTPVIPVPPLAGGPGGPWDQASPGGPAGTDGQPPVHAPGPEPRSHRRRLLLTIAAAIVLIAGGALAFGLSGGGNGKTSLSGPTPLADATRTSASARPSSSTSQSRTHGTATKPATPKPKPKPKKTVVRASASPTPAASTAPAYVASPTPYNGTTPASSPAYSPSPTPSTPKPSPKPSPTTAAPQAVISATNASSYSCSGPEPSSPGGAATYTFNNDSAAAVLLYRYSTSAVLEGEGSVSPHSSVSVATAAGYFWEVTGPAGTSDCLGEYQIGGSGSLTVGS